MRPDFRTAVTTNTTAATTGCPPMMSMMHPTFATRGCAALARPMPQGGWRSIARLAACFCLATLLASAGCGSEEEAEGGSHADSEVISRRSFPLVVIAKGELESKERVEINNRVEGNTTITDLIAEGSEVQGPLMFMSSHDRTIAPGTLLCTLAVDEINDKIEQATLDVAQSRADQVSAQQNLAIKLSEAQSDEDSARVKLEQARRELGEWENGTDPKKRRELDLALEKAQRNLSRAKRDLEESQTLYEERFISLGELEDAEIAVIEAQNALATAQLDIQVYSEYTQPKERQELLNNVAQAEAELDRTIERNQNELAQMRADLASKQRRLAIREARLDKLRQQRRDTRVMAPREGVVVYATSVGSSRWRRTSLARGTSVRYNDELFYLPDPGQMIAAVKVHEAMYSQVKIGQPVSVDIDARPGESIEGKVVFVAATAESGDWLNPDLREYLVRVELPPGLDRSLKPAMRCTARILTGQVDNVVAAPVQAVHTERDQRFCYVDAGGGRWRKTAVTIGRASESLVEVTSGLSEGDRVLLRNPTPGEVINEVAGDQPEGDAAEAADPQSPESGGE